MLKYFRSFISENILLKITSYNSLAIGVRILAGLITARLIAFYLGASGMALLGDLRNFLSSVQSLSTLGIANGIIKYTSQLKSSKKGIGKLWSTSFAMVVLTSLLLSAILFFNAESLNILIFQKGYDFTSFIEWTAFALPFYTVNVLLMAIINGLGKYRRIILINIATNLLGLVITVFLIIQYRIEGALFALIIAPALALLITLASVFRKRYHLRFFSVAGIKGSYIKKLASYSGMTLFSAIASPWIYIAIRQFIIDTDGIENAGYWDAMLRLSDYYLMFATSLMTLYVLPKLAEVDTSREFRKVIFGFYKTILPLFALGLIAIYLLRTFLIRLVFTTKFLEMEPIFIWQLAGDLFRVASIVIAYQFIAKNKFWLFISTQILSLGIIYYSSIYFVTNYGFVGASMGHLLSYVVYFVMMLFIFRKSLFGRV